MPGRLKTLLLLAPAALVVGGLFGGGLVLAVLRSLGWSPALGETSLDLSAYRALLAGPDFWPSLALSLHIAVTSTLISAVLALAAALLLRQSFAGRRLIGVIFQLNLTVPHIVGALGILYLFSQSGSLARLAHAAGAIGGPADFPALVWDRAAVGVILTYVWKEVPFIGVILLANMQAQTADWEAAARTLGAGRWQTFRHVTLPSVLPALLSASAIVFAFAFGAYEIPALLGASFPEALPVLAWRQFTDVDLAARPEAMATSVVIALVSAGAILVSMRAARARLGR